MIAFHLKLPELALDRKPSRRGLRKNAYGYLVKGIIFYPIEVGDPSAQVGSRTHFTLPVLSSYRSNGGVGVKSLDHRNFGRFGTLGIWNHYSPPHSIFSTFWEGFGATFLRKLQGAYRNAALEECSEVEEGKAGL
ncbi:hypothetical protein AKJ66_01825 [candidate division MSBL1 archaeon SCGC-AAA259E22]|uniref:Uncharacterized protein n=1 Tax=candidate division MSBL1 archaeon SCGC-AAA259E22 TaxID=1698265 RepID=A0A133UH60_9EURY|nr:hypothetical protein AKJ66_01825 [candidate division MSBL1 archaeon SCGC-AAA259E22]